MTAAIYSKRDISLLEKKIPVVEVFGPTIQGEGPNTGALTHFVRTGLCGYRCTWCDSMHAVLPEEVKANAQYMTPMEIVHKVKEMKGASRVVFSGGDPVIHQGLKYAVEALMVEDIVCDVETQGELWPDNFFEYFSTVVLSPKGPSSGNITNIKKFAKGFEKQLHLVEHVCIKIVIKDTRADVDYAFDLLEHLAHCGDAPHTIYFNAASPLPDSDGVIDTEYIMHIYRALVKMIPGHFVTSRTLRSWLSKVHIGAQQHALLWPTESRGV